MSTFWNIPTTGQRFQWESATSEILKHPGKTQVRHKPSGAVLTVAELALTIRGMEPHEAEAWFADWVVVDDTKTKETQ